MLILGSVASVCALGFYKLFLELKVKSAVFIEMSSMYVSSPWEFRTGLICRPLGRFWEYLLSLPSFLLTNALLSSVPLLLHPILPYPATLSILQVCRTMGLLHYYLLEGLSAFLFWSQDTFAHSHRALYETTWDRGRNRRFPLSPLLVEPRSIPLPAHICTQRDVHVCLVQHSASTQRAIVILILTF